MLSFIPMNEIASIFSQTGSLDDWGQTTWEHMYTGKCQILCNQDLSTVSLIDGNITTMSTTIVFQGRVNVRVGDKLEYKDILGTKQEQIVEDVYFAPDWGGKIVFTRVVSGKGKRF